jgi:hypothetical protein
MPRVGGCTSCGSKSGCDDRKGDMFAVLDQVIARIYPTARWGEPDDRARFAAGVGEDDGQALAEELGQTLDAATFFRAGGDDDYCDYVYVLCLGREPCAVQIRDGEVAVPDELGDGVRLDELYLRVCLSSLARLAGVQQVAMTLERSGDDLLIREMPRAGVYDAPLLRRLQKLVAVLPAYDITHVDFGEISAPMPDFDPGDYLARYGTLPHRANYLFYPQPTTTESTTLLTVAGRTAQLG